MRGVFLLTVLAGFGIGVSATQYDGATRWDTGVSFLASERQELTSQGHGRQLCESSSDCASMAAPKCNTNDNTCGDCDDDVDCTDAGVGGTCQSGQCIFPEPENRLGSTIPAVLILGMGFHGMIGFPILICMSCRGAQDGLAWYNFGGKSDVLAGIIGGFPLWNLMGVRNLQTMWKDIGMPSVVAGFFIFLGGGAWFWCPIIAMLLGWAVVGEAPETVYFGTIGGVWLFVASIFWFWVPLTLLLFCCGGTGWRQAADADQHRTIRQSQSTSCFDRIVGFSDSNDYAVAEAVIKAFQVTGLAVLVIPANSTIVKIIQWMFRIFILDFLTPFVWTLTFGVCVAFILFFNVTFSAVGLRLAWQYEKDDMELETNVAARTRDYEENVSDGWKGRLFSKLNGSGVLFMPVVRGLIGMAACDVGFNSGPAYGKFSGWNGGDSDIDSSPCRWDEASARWYPPADWVADTSDANLLFCGQAVTGGKNKSLCYSGGHGVYIVLASWLALWLATGPGLMHILAEVHLCGRTVDPNLDLRLAPAMKFCEISINVCLVVSSVLFNGPLSPIWLWGVSFAFFVFAIIAVAVKPWSVIPYNAERCWLYLLQSGVVWWAAFAKFFAVSAFPAIMIVCGWATYFMFLPCVKRCASRGTAVEPEV